MACTERRSATRSLLGHPTVARVEALRAGRIDGYRWRTLKEHAWKLVPLARADAHQTVPERCGARSAPAEFRSDVLEDAFEHVGVVVHTQLVRDGEEQRIGRLDSLVAREFFDQHVGFGGVRAAEDGPRVRVDVAGGRKRPGRT